MIELSDKIETSNIPDLKIQILKTKLNITTVEDFINIYPYKHQIIKKINKISEINNTYAKIEVEIHGTIKNISKTTGKHGEYLTANITDNTGSLTLYWFKNINKILKYIENNKNYIILGEITSFNNTFSIIHPTIITKTLSNDKILAKYHKVTNFNITLDSRFFRKTNEQIFKNINQIPDYLPEHIIKKYRLISEHAAIQNIHTPKNDTLLKESIRRLKFDELFIMQLKRLYFYSKKEKTNGIICSKTDLLNEFYKNDLKLELTTDQKKAIKDIYNDLKSGNQMNRLLQGDVGCGKTLVAFISTLIVIDSNYQVAILAPTEILAKQHFETYKNLCKNKNIRIELLTGSTKTKDKNTIINDINNGSINVIIGTHSLLNEQIEYKNLGLVIIDEQHKFGVTQRLSLINSKNNSSQKPHILSMTATPIPRTLSMVLYDDFSISTIKELPSNRKPIKTVHITENSKKYMLDFIKKELEKGRQAYFIYPLIDESEKINLSNITQSYRLLSQEFSNYNISILHGNMPSKLKEEEIEKFINNENQILISTTVIEVGINVPNATIMVIEDADRYGLAQLHQIRGRVGRSEYNSYCFLITKNKLSTYSKNRIDTLTKYNDGFIISEEDLKLRGGGNTYGEEQSGELKLKIANLYDDMNILETAKKEAKDFLSNYNIDEYKELKLKITKNDINYSNII